MGAIGNLIGKAFGYDPAGEATDAQVQSAKDATQAQLEMFYKSREDTAPWREIGAEALRDVAGAISAGPGEFKNSDYYNFLLDEGTKARARSASATGRMDSGAALREAERFGQNLAGAQRENYINEWLKTKINPRLSLAGSGQVAATNDANAALQTGSAIGTNAILAGNARATGYMNEANRNTASVNAITQGFNNYLFYNKLNQTPNYVYSGPTGAGTDYAQYYDYANAGM